MSDTLTVSLGSASYEFLGGPFVLGRDGFHPGIPAPTGTAVAEWKADPSPRNWPYVVMHGEVERSIAGYVDCDTDALARAELALIVAVCKPGAVLTWQADGQASPLHCQVLDTDVVPGSLDPSTRNGCIDCTVTLTTTPYWVGPDKTETLTVTAGTPWAAAMTAVVGGDVPALTETRYTHAQVVTALSVGLRSNPASGTVLSDLLWSPWSDALVGADRRWGTLSRQKAANGRYWGTYTGGHGGYAAGIFSSADGDTWDDTPVSGANFSPISSSGGILCQGTTANGVSVGLAIDGTNLYLCRTTNPDVRVLPDWTLTLLWSRTSSTDYPAAGTSGLVDLGSGKYGLTLQGEYPNGYVNGLLVSDDDFATYAPMPFWGYNDTVVDPDLGSVTLSRLMPNEQAVACHPDGQLMVAHVRYEAHAGYEYAGPATWQTAQTGGHNSLFTDAIDGSTYYAGGLLQSVTLDGGATWHYTGRARTAANSAYSNSTLAPPFFAVGGDGFELAGRIYFFCTDRRYAYDSSHALTNDSRTGASAVWMYSIDAETLRSRVAAAVAAGHPEYVNTPAQTAYYCPWTLGAEIVRPTSSSTAYLAGMVTAAKVSDTQYIISVVEEPSSNADTYVMLAEVAAASTFTPVQDYIESPGDTQARGGNYSGLTTGATQATIGTPRPLDAAGMRGDYLVLARVKCSGATVAAEFIRAQSSVVGAIGAAATINGGEVNPVSVSSAGYDVLPLGVMSIPAGRVQAGLGGGGYGPETLKIDGSGWTCASTAVVDSTHTLTQTYKAVLNQAVSFWVHCAVAGPLVIAALKRGSTVLATRSLQPDAAWVEFRWPAIVPVTPGETLTVEISRRLGGGPTLYYSSGTSRYADGALTGTGIAATSDLAFKVYERPAVIFDTSMDIQARASTGTPTVRLDTVALIPTDEGVVRVTMPATTAGQGIDIDYLSEDENEHGVYIADATNTGTSLIATAEPYNPLLLRPGANTLVGMASTPITDAPGNATVTVTWRERYLIPYTGV